MTDNKDLIISEQFSKEKLQENFVCPFCKESDWIPISYDITHPADLLSPIEVKLCVMCRKCGCKITMEQKILQIKNEEK